MVNEATLTQYDWPMTQYQRIMIIGHSLHHVDADLLGWWLAERQLPSGGLNGRPEKLPDVWCDGQNMCGVMDKGTFVVVLYRGGPMPISRKCAEWFFLLVSV